METGLGKKLNDVRKNGDLWWLLPEQSPDIAGGEYVGKEEDYDDDVGGQDIMFGYASDETEDALLLIHSMATRLGKKLNDMRKNGDLWWFRPKQSPDTAGGEHVGKDD